MYLRMVLCLDLTLMHKGGIMNTKMKIAFACYMLVALISVLIGLRYFFSSEIMQYHQEVIGMSWADVQPRFQKMFLAFMNGAGLSLFTQGLALIILLFIPFRRGEIWARWAIPALILPSFSFLQYVTVYLKSTTQASTPWELPAIILLLTIAAIPLSYARSK